MGHNSRNYCQSSTAALTVFLQEVLKDFPSGSVRPPFAKTTAPKKHFWQRRKDRHVSFLWKVSVTCGYPDLMMSFYHQTVKILRITTLHQYYERSLTKRHLPAKGRHNTLQNYSFPDSRGLSTMDKGKRIRQLKLWLFSAFLYTDPNE